MVQGDTAGVPLDEVVSADTGRITFVSATSTESKAWLADLRYEWQGFGVTYGVPATRLVETTEGTKFFSLTFYNF